MAEEKTGTVVGSTKQLIVTADDFGYSTERNQGIVECYRTDAVTRSSLMVNGVAAQHGCQLAKQCGLPLGLHFNVVEGRPLTSGQSLVKADGCLYSMLGSDTFSDQVNAGNIVMSEIRTELRAQLDKFQDLTGQAPLYVDGHQHAHLLPGISEVFAEELASRGIRETRLPAELRLYGWVDLALIPFLQQVVEEARAAGKVFREKGIRFPDRFVGMETMGRAMTSGRLQQLVESAYDTNSPLPQQPGILSCELMVHPGYACAGEGGCGDGADDFSRSHDRVHEMEVIKSADMLQWYKDSNVRLVSCLA